MKMNMKEIKKLYDDYVLATYTRQDLCLVKGDGIWVEDTNGKKYLDFFPGWAVSGVGHRHPAVIKRVNEQLGRILHVSNNFYNEVQPLLARKIIEHSFAGKVFFGNSGAEANEGAIKLARRYGHPDRFEIITMERSFHGRTLATLTATGQDKVKKGFTPLPEGFKHVPFNDIKAFERAITPRTVAVMLEPIQGEGGINVADEAYIKTMRGICDKHDMLMIFDEVQTCMGRTGKMFAFSHYGVEPDAMTLAKSLGGGFPIGALVVNNKKDKVLTAGTHASTFGGSPVVCAAALGVFDAIENGDLLANTVEMGEYIVKKLVEIREKKQVIKEIRGKGLMIGVEIDMEDASSLPVKCMEQGLLINCTQNNILRIMPPVTVRKEEADKAINILSNVLEKI